MHTVGQFDVTFNQEMTAQLGSQWIWNAEVLDGG